MTPTAICPRPEPVRLQKDHYGEGWHTERRGRPGYLLAPHHAAHCPCGKRRLPTSPLCYDCHTSIFEALP